MIASRYQLVIFNQYNWTIRDNRDSSVSQIGILCYTKKKKKWLGQTLASVNMVHSWRKWINIARKHICHSKRNTIFCLVLNYYSMSRSIILCFCTSCCHRCASAKVKELVVLNVLAECDISCEVTNQAQEPYIVHKGWLQPLGLKNEANAKMPWTYILSNSKQVVTHLVAERSSVV